MRIFVESYSNCLPQSRQTTYGPPCGTPAALMGVIGRVSRPWRHRNSRLKRLSIMVPDQVAFAITILSAGGYY